MQAGAPQHRAQGTFNGRTPREPRWPGISIALGCDHTAGCRSYLHREPQLAHIAFVTGGGDDLEEIVPRRQAVDRQVDPSVGSAPVKVSRGKHDGLVARDCAPTIDDAHLRRDRHERVGACSALVDLEKGAHLIAAAEGALGRGCRGDAGRRRATRKCGGTGFHHDIGQRTGARWTTSAPGSARTHSPLFPHSGRLPSPEFHSLRVQDPRASAP